MADNITYSGTGSSVPANTVQKTDDVGGAHVPYVKLLDGTADGSGAIPGDATNGLDVDVTRVSGVVHVDDNSSTLSVDDGAGSLTVDGAVSITGSVAVTDNSGSLSVDDNGGSLTVDNAGTFAVQAAQSGTWNVGTLTSITNVVHVDDNSSTLSIDDGAGSITVDGSVSVTGTVTVDSELTTADLDSGAGTDTRAVVGIVLAKSGGGQLLAAGQTTMASSAPVTIASDQSAVPASQSGTWNIATVTTVTGVTNVVHVDDNASTLSIDDGAGSITVDGTVATTQSGTWSVRNQDGSGNSLTSATRGSERALSVQIVDGSGAQVTTFGGSGGTASNFGSAFPSQGTAVGAKDSAGTNMQPLNLDASGNLKVNVAAGGGSGGTSSSFGSAFPATGTAAGITDGTNMVAPKAVAAAMDTTSGVMAAGLVGQLDDTSTTTVTENQFAPVRISSRRALLVEGVASGTVIPVSDGAGSLTVDNGGTFAVQDSEKVVDNAGFTDGTTKVLPAGYILDETAGTALTENDAAAARIDSKRAQVLVIEDATTRGQRATVSATGALKVDPSASNGVVSTANSTTSNLAGGATFTGTSEDVTNYAAIQVTVFSSHVSATDGLSLQQSSDGTNWDITDTYTIPATTGKTFSVQPAAKFFRLVYTNGATLTTSLRIQVVYHVQNPKPSSQRPQDALSNENDMEQAWVFASLYNGTTWDRMRGDITNGLDVDVTRVTGTVTVDSELPAAAALADAASNPTSPLVGDCQMVYNGTTWDRVRESANSTNSTGTGIPMAGIVGQLDDTSTSAVTENQFAHVRISSRRALLVEGVASGTNMNVAVASALPTGTNALGTVTLDDAGTGWSSHSLTSAASANATNVKASAGRLHGVEAFNSNASVRYLKLYNTAGTPTAGSGTPFRRYMIPAGGGLVISYPSPGITFSSGLGYTLVTGAADTNSTGVAADEIHLNLSYT